LLLGKHFDLDSVYLGDTGLISRGHLNITTIRTIKGLEADLVFSKTERDQNPIKANTPQP